MDYYKSNALYEHITAKKIPNLKFVAGNAWQIVYGDKTCNPKVLVFLVGVPNIEIDAPPSDAHIEGFNLLSNIATRSNLPLRYIRFACDLNEVENVKYSDSSFNYQTLNMLELSALFSEFSLPISNTSTAKYLNDKTSSAYHNWQRKCLGSALTVCDIDLWKLDGLLPTKVFELKRSFYKLENWNPFTDDYRNFRLLSNLCNVSGLQFKIIYNQRINNPFEDKIDRLKVFSVDFSKIPNISVDGIINLNGLENV